MKKTIQSLISLMMIFSLLIGCTSKKASEPIVYNSDLTINYVYHETTENHLIAFVLENISAKKISEAEFLLVGYDRSGKVINASSPVKNIKVNDAGLDVGSKKLFHVGDSGIEDSVYYRIIVYRLTFADASVWKFDSYDRWSEELPSTLDVNAEQSEQQSKIEAGLAAIQIPENVAVTSISQTTLKTDYPDQGIELKLENLTDRTITNVVLLVSMFDENSLPISVPKDNQTLASNIKKLPYAYVIKPKEATGQLSADQFFVLNTRKFNAIVFEVTFDDGSVWTNTNAIYWIHQIPQ